MRVDNKGLLFLFLRFFQTHAHLRLFSVVLYLNNIHIDSFFIQSKFAREFYLLFFFSFRSVNISFVNDINIFVSKWRAQLVKIKNFLDEFFSSSYKIGLLPNDEATLKRLSTYPGIEGIILTNEDGQLHYTSLDNNVTFIITPKLLAFAEMARSAIRDICPADNLISLRLRTRQKEVMVVAPKDGIRIIAIQKINVSSQTTQPDKEYNDNY